MARRVYPIVARLKSAFWPGLTFLPSLLAIADEVFEWRFRDAAIEGGEVALWVKTLPMDSAPVPPDVRCCSKSDHSRRECEMTLRAMCGQVTAFTAGPGILMLGSQEGSSS
jgi:hypothetical protein